MKTKTLTLLAFLIMASFGAKSQDFIYKKNREILKVKLIEVGTEEIKFKDFDNPDGPVFSIEKEKVTKIEMENGDIKVMESTDRFDDPDYYTDQHKNVIKWSFTSIMFNHLDFSYERSLTPSSSFEVGLGIIGAGFSPSDEINPEIKRKPTGVALRGGYKFKRSPDYYLPKMRYGHLLKGGYIKPELIMTFYGEDFNTYDHITNGYNTERNTAVSGAFMIDFGKQWVFSDRLAVDFYVGIGYGFSTSKNNEAENYNFEQTIYTLSPIQYSYILLPGNFPMAFTGGLSLGYVFGY